MSKYEIHPVAALFPRLEGEELAELVRSIRSKGLLNAITVYKGKILDGCNREVACEVAGVEPVYVEWSGEGDPSDWIVATNLHRRHLTISQRGLIAVELKKRYEATARDRMLLGKDVAVPAAGVEERGEDEGGGHPRDGSDDLGGSTKGRAIDHAAKVTGVSPMTVSRAAKLVSTAAPELIDAVRIGDVTVTSALDIAKLPADAQRKALRDRKVRETTRALREPAKPPSPPPVPALRDCSPLNLTEFRAAYRKGPSIDRRQPGHEVARLQQIALTVMLVDRAWTWITAEWDSDQREDMSFALNEAKEMTPLLKEFGRRLTATIAKCSTEAADALRASAAAADAFEAGVAAAEAPCEGVADKE